MTYDWQRFWCSRDASYSLQDGGFLTDPQANWGSVLNPHLLVFHEVANVPCLVLLGEPGIGKTRAIEASQQSIDANLHAAGHESLRVDLRIGDSEERLIRKIFESPTFRAWQEGSHELFLFLDSLDECLLRVDTVAGLLLEELRHYPTDRLRLRIACRTAEWPLFLENGLLAQWGHSAVQVIEMVPLRRADVAVAAQAHGVNPEAFLEAVLEAEAVPLAIRPVTLNFLLNTYLQAGSLPSNQAELYQSGCRLLCEELNESRRASKAKGHLTQGQRMIVAGRIAALTLLSSRYAVYTEADQGDLPPGTLTLSEISGGTESTATGTFSVTESAVQEVLGTGLFSSRGTGLLGWSHQTYAEYLAAWYLCQKKVSQDQILALICHPDDTGVHLVPQLEEMAAWIAGMAPDIFRRIMESDPAVLLRSDVGTADVPDRKRLVEKLLEKSAEGSLPDLIVNYRQRFRKLHHPRLPEQLRPIIVDGSRNPFERIVAIDIAEACQSAELQSDLADIALDRGNAVLVRVQAAYAVQRIGDVTTRSRLRPLVSVQAADDPDDELKGCGLRALWPDVLTAEELFPLISVPRNSGLYGAYSSFIENELADHLQASDLVVALRWAAQYRSDHSRLAPQEKLAWQIVQHGWDEMDKPGVLEPFAAAILNRLRQHIAIPDTFAISDLPVPDISISDTAVAVESSDVQPAIQNYSKRRRLVEAVVAQMSDPDSDFHLMAFLNPPLIVPADIPWLIQQADKAAGTGLQRTYARLIDRNFNYNDAENFEFVVSASRRGGVLTEILLPRFEAILLGSPRAQQLQEYAREEEEWRSPPPRTLLMPPPSELIIQHLDRFDGGALNAWWLLNLDMTLKPDSTHYGSEYGFDLTQEPGWQAADGQTRFRMLAAAETYLHEQDPETGKWIGTDVLHRPDWAGYRALHLLLSERREGLVALPDPVWTKWIPVILNYPVFASSETNEKHRLMVGLAFQRNPEAVIKALLDIIDRDIAKGQPISILDTMKYCWNPALASVLLEKARGDGLMPGNVAVLLGELLKLDDAALSGIRDEARAFAASLIAAYANKLKEYANKPKEAGDPNEVGEPKESDSRSMALVAAHELMLHTSDAGWPEVWPLVQEDIDFGRALMEKVACRDRRRGWIAHCLSDDRAADLFLWLASQYPHSEDPQHVGVHHVGPRDEIAQWRDSLLSNLERKGTTAAVHALQRIVRDRADLFWLRSLCMRALEAMRRNTWMPLTPDQILRLTDDSSLRSIQSGHQLLQVVIESLERLQAKLTGETPMAQFLWSNMPDGKAYRPKDEEAFSDYVKCHLASDLEERGIVVNREVQIRRGLGTTKGQDTDIHVDALSRGPGADKSDVISLIIESKGCWHRELKTAMRTQLVGRYLKDNECRHGIYLIGWFRSDSWDRGDGRQKQTPKATIEKIKTEFASQAAQLSVGTLEIATVVLDVPL